MTGTEFADILRDARLLSACAPQYAWVRAWETQRYVPLCTLAADAASAAGRDGLLAVWLHGLSQAFRGRYAVGAAEFAAAADEAADALHRSGCLLLPAAVHAARHAQTFSAWSAAAYAACLQRAEDADGNERVFLPWFEAMYARYVQE